MAYSAFNRVIGKDGKIPWYYPEDLKRFKEQTLYKPILMGKNTYLSICSPKRNKLPDRRNIVISKTLKLDDSVGVEVVDSIDAALKLLNTDVECFIIGGESIYKQTQNLVSNIYVTEINKRHDGDTYYPEIPSSFKEVYKIEHPEFSFLKYERKV